MATTLRLMAGAELATEGFKKGQVGSSAMPHKMNARSSERINGFTVLLRGYVTAISELAGSQWNEGDVACSVVRRVVLPDSFYAIDGLLETALTVLGELGIFERAISAELDRNLPFLATTKILMAAIKNGVGRENAHEVIKEQLEIFKLAVPMICSNELQQIHGFHLIYQRLRRLSPLHLISQGSRASKRFKLLQKLPKLPRVIRKQQIINRVQFGDWLATS
jgi:adenylosuccinate lyase